MCKSLGEVGNEPVEEGHRRALQWRFASVQSQGTVLEAVALEELESAVGISCFFICGLKQSPNVRYALGGLNSPPKDVHIEQDGVVKR